LTGHVKFHEDQKVLSTKRQKTERTGVARLLLAVGIRRQLTVVAALVLSGLAEGFGLASLLPVVALVSKDPRARESTVSRFVVAALARVGLPATLGVLLIVVVAALIVKSALRLFAMSYVGYAVVEVVTGLQSSLLENLLGARWAYFTRQPVGRFANAVSQETSRAGEAYFASIQVIGAAIEGTVYVGLAFLISWKLALVSLIVGGAIALVLSSLVRTGQRAGRLQTRRSHELIVTLTDLLIAIKPIKAMARHAQLGSVLERKVGELKAALRQQVLARQAVQNLQEPLLVLFLAGALYLALTLWSGSLGELMVMGLLLARTVAMTGQVQRYVQNAAIAESAYWSVRSLIDEAGQNREPAGGTLRPKQAPTCRFENVSFSYGLHSLLKDVSMVVPAGKITLITGASGAGKTTVSDLLVGFYRPDSGRVLIDDDSLDEIDLNAWRSVIGYVSQEVILFHDTVFNNLTLGDQSVDRERAQQALEIAGAWEFIAAKPRQMDTIVGERGTMLSGGQRQRIAVARALVHEPRFLILDEATTGLDAATAASFRSNIISLAGERTILVIAHDRMWTLCADVVYSIHHGKIELVRWADAHAG
jgi:ATP-binding cassette, subfamily C, bacterial